MKDRIVIQQYTTTVDDWNHKTKSWTTARTVWAQKLYKNSQLVSEVKGVTHVMTVIFRMRHIDGVGTTNRVLQGSEIYDIVGMKILGNKEGLELITVQRDADSAS
jgi:SPP1 family predicted phage head-tail adaptor